MSLILLREPAPASDPEVSIPGLEELHKQMRSFGVAATIVPCAKGVVLEGFATSYYGKQMAQEIARTSNLNVFANRIRVQRDGNSPWQPAHD